MICNHISPSVDCFKWIYAKLMTSIRLWRESLALVRKEGGLIAFCNSYQSLQFRIDDLRYELHIKQLDMNDLEAEIARLERGEFDIC